MIELAVAALLRTLAAELRPYIEELVETAVPELVLDVGANHAGGVFWAQRQRLSFIAFGAAAILPSKHFFADNVCLFTYTSGEQFGGFENGRTDFLEVVGAKDVTDGGFDKVPQRRFGREKVAGSSGGFDSWSLVAGHWSFDRSPLVVRCSRSQSPRPEARHSGIFGT